MNVMPITRHRWRFYFQEVSIVTSLWMFVALLCVYIKFNDVPEELIRAIYGFQPSVTKFRLYEFAFLISLFIGIVMGLTHTFLYPRIVRTGNFMINILLRLLIFFTLTFLTLAFFLLLSGLSPLAFNKFSVPGSERSVLDVFFYLILVEVLVGLNVTIRKNLGKDYVKKLINNAYFTPKEEYRVFMFTDLKNSTILVEKMGSLRFSQFIQECFRDFSEAAINYGGEIYQFVGDEVVTTWKAGGDFNYTDCLNLHFALSGIISSKRDFYESSYGVVPEFRTSLHCGEVSAALVGTYKTEIAYHGGVLNLCSRLQSVCRDEEADLIVSENFYRKIQGMINCVFFPLSDIELKGIAAKQLIYKVQLSKVDEASNAD